MRKPFYIILALAMSFVLFSCDDDINQPTVNDTPEEVETSIFQQFNDFRTSQGVQTYTRDALVDSLCKDHSEKMASGARPFGHEGEEQRKQIIGISGSGSYSYSEFVSQNLGYKDPATQIFNGWKDDQDKYAMLDDEYQRVGIGCAKASDGTYYVTFIMMSKGL